MITQGEYGGDAELVPNGLRAYRHYGLNGITLTPTITLSNSVGPGVNLAKCYAAPSSLADKSCSFCNGRGEAFSYAARPFNYADLFSEKAFDPIDNWDVQRVKCDCLRECEAPTAGCTCGFYASYSPGVNFFSGYAFGFGRNFSALPPIFAVVEASGRVLMGSKGVRAQKMRVVALALDMEHISAMNIDPFYGFPTSQNDYRLRDLDCLGLKYDVPVFGYDIPRMIEAFPQPDLSNLIKNQRDG